MKKSVIVSFLVIFQLMLVSVIQTKASVVKKYFERIYDKEERNDPNLYFKFAEKLYEMEQYRVAIRYAKHGLTFAGSKKNKSAQIKLLELIGNSYNKQGVNDSAVIIFQKVLETAKLSTDGSSDIPEALSRISRYYRDNGEIVSALNTMKEAVRILELEGTPRKIADYYDKLSRLYEARGEYDKALSFYERAKSIWIQLADEKKLIRSITSIGVIYLYWGEYDEAIARFNRCLNIAEKLNLKKEVSGALNNLGVVFNAMNRLDKCKEYCQKALQIDLEIGDKRKIALDYNNLGAIYSNFEQYDSALLYYHEALTIYDSLNRDNDKVDVLSNIALNYKMQKNKSKSLHYINQALKLVRKSGNPDLVAEVELNAGMIHASYENYNRATNHFNEALQIASKYGLKAILMKVYDELSKLNEKEGIIDEALVFYKKYWEMKDSLLSEGNQHKFAELEAKYESEKKEKEIELLNSEKTHQEEQIAQQIQNRRMIIILFITAFVLLVSIFFIFYQRYRIKHKHLLAEAIAEQQKLRFTSVLLTEEKERKRIAQDLHDSLGQILSTAKLNLSGMESAVESKEEPTKKIYTRTVQLIDQACGEVRNISHNIMPSTLIRVGLIAAIKDLIDKVNSSPEINVEISSNGFPEKLDEKTEFALYRIVQEIMSNIIKHSKANKVNIELTKENYKLVCQIKDNGIGLSQDQISNSTGIGWKNIYSRLDLINGRMDINSEKGNDSYTIIKIEFPFSLN